MILNFACKITRGQVVCIRPTTHLAICAVHPLTDPLCTQEEDLRKDPVRKKTPEKALETRAPREPRVDLPPPGHAGKERLGILVLQTSPPAFRSDWFGRAGERRPHYRLSFPRAEHLFRERRKRLIERGLQTGTEILPNPPPLLEFGEFGSRYLPRLLDWRADRSFDR